MRADQEHTRKDAALSQDAWLMMRKEQRQKLACGKQVRRYTKRSSEI